MQLFKIIRYLPTRKSVNLVGTELQLLCYLFNWDFD